jgi:hypothetical protein
MQVTVQLDDGEIGFEGVEWAEFAQHGIQHCFLCSWL